MKEFSGIKPQRKQLLHDRLADELRDVIKRGHKPGNRLEPESVLAKRAGVSIVTLRNAMLILEREGLIQRTPGRGTFVAEKAGEEGSGFRVQGSTHIAIYCGGEVFGPRPSYFHLGAISALRRFFTEQNMVTQTYFNHREIENRQVEGQMVEAGDTCPELTQAIADKRVHAAIFLAGGKDTVWARALTAQAIPFVGTSIFDVGVTTDWIDLGRLGARHLAATGCRRLALLGWACPNQLDKGARNDMVSGFCDEVLRLQLTLNKNWIRHELPPEEDGSGWEEFREVWNASPEKPDGLVITDDILFPDIIRAVTELGIRVPAELKIISHTNRGACYPAPFPVDRLEYDPLEHGRTLGNLLMQQLKGEMPAEPVMTLYHKLVINNGISSNKQDICRAEVFNR
jgi:DNA-binding LacI/PurR family transcriptional regulator/DNA-binding transcriptional regulator YhcF (GntR family)